MYRKWIEIELESLRMVVRMGREWRDCTRMLRILVLRTGCA
jgi:hypothetical protein